MTEFKNQTHCPSDDELMQYKLGNSAKEKFQEITEHLVTCNVCPRTILDFLPETEEEWQRLKAKVDEVFDDEDGDQSVEDFLSEDLLREFEQMRGEATRLEEKRKDFDRIDLQGLRSGQIWRPKTDNIVVPAAGGNEYVSEIDLDSKNHFVAITSAEPERVGDYNVIKVIPVDTDLSCAAEDDVIIPARYNPREKDLILQVWNEKEMLVENLEGYFGDVADEWVKSEQEKRRTTFTSGNLGIKELFAEFKKNLSDFAYEPLNIIRQGLIANPVYRYRAKEVAETNYLSFPVESLRYAEARKKSSVKVTAASLFRAFLEEIKSTFSMFPSPTFISAADDSQSVWEEDEQTYFDGKLKCKRRKSAEGQNLLMLQSDVAEFANRFVLLGKDEADLTLAFLAENNPIHQGYVSVLNFGENESPRKGFSNKILDVVELPKFDAQLIQSSIARVYERSELSAWKKLADDAAKTDENVSQIIHQAIKQRERKKLIDLKLQKGD